MCCKDVSSHSKLVKYCQFELVSQAGPQAIVGVTVLMEHPTLVQ